MSNQLKIFSDSELIFDEEETRQILKFFFPYDNAAIDKMTIDNKARNFAQAVLVEAVDASYKMGYVEALFQSVCRFKGSKDFMKTFAKKAMKHWFEHATQKDLMRVKIYESIRVSIQWQCHDYLDMLIKGLVKVKGRSTYVATKPHRYIETNHEILWG